MDHFNYWEGFLHAEEVPVDTIAEAVETPFYCYSTATLERHFRVFEAAMPKNTLIAYAVKANGNIAVIKTPKDKIVAGPVMMVDTVLVDSTNVPPDGKWPW